MGLISPYATYSFLSLVVDLHHRQGHHLCSLSLLLRIARYYILVPTLYLEEQISETTNAACTMRVFHFKLMSSPLLCTPLEA